MSLVADARRAPDVVRCIAARVVARVRLSRLTFCHAGADGTCLPSPTSPHQRYRQIPRTKTGLSEDADGSPRLRLTTVTVNVMSLFVFLFLA